MPVQMNGVFMEYLHYYRNYLGDFHSRLGNIELRYEKLN